MSQSSEDLSFSIDSRLLEELGENLVTKNHVAVAELIKNAYDADATQVELQFINARQDGEGRRSEIRIEDNGVGMTYDEIDENWMRIGTTDKVRNPRTEKFGREKTGNKGIGRFSCRRLGYRLELTSIAEDPDSDQYIKSYIEFPWNEFARNTDVDEIPVESEVEYLDKADTGVTLRILDLRDEWNQRDFNTLRRNVLTLSVVQQQRRDGYKEDPGFDIVFDAPEFDQGEGSLLDQVYEAGWCEMQGKFNKNGDVELSIKGKKIGKRSHTIKKDYDGLEETDFKIAFIPRQKKHFRDTSTLSLERAREITGEYGGIRVYRDGFRIYPYGGPGDDWLGIDRYYSRRIGSPDEEFDDLSDKMDLHNDFNRTMLVHPRNENLIGRIGVGTDANLEMKTDREGFIQNDTFEEMKEGIRLALQWLTLQYSNYLSIRQKEEFQDQAEDFLEQVEESEGESKDSDGDNTEQGGESTTTDEGETDEVTSSITDWTGDDGQGGGSSSGSNVSTSVSGSASSSTNSTDTKAVNEAVSVIQKATETVAERTDEDEEEMSDIVETASEIVQKSVKKNRQEIDFYRSAFSVNQFVFSFMHELRDVIVDLETNKTDLDSVADSMSSPEADKVKEVADDLDELKKRFEQQMNLFGILTDSEGDVEAETQRLQEEVEKLISSVDYISEDYDISIESDIPINLYTPPMHRTELYSVLINLLTNSIKAVIADGGEDNRILIEGTKEGEEVILRVHDSGIGIPPEHHEEIVEPLISDPQDNLYDRLEDEMPSQLSSQLGSGSGLGLSIVSEIANKYGGGLKFIDSEDWATTAEVTLHDE
jgi:signal transduction histidine kinase